MAYNKILKGDTMRKLHISIFIIFLFNLFFIANANAAIIKNLTNIKKQLEQDLDIKFLPKDQHSELSFEIGRLDAQKLYYLQHFWLTRALNPLNDLSPKLISIILNKATINSNEKFNADISFYFVDLKYDGKNFKILEFGEGKNGGYRAWDGVFGTPGSIWQKFWTFLKSFDIPIWYIGPTGEVIVNKLGINADTKYSLEAAQDAGVHILKSLEDIRKHELFKTQAAQTEKIDGTSISSHKGIIVYRYRDDREPRCLKALESFKKEFPQFLFLDEVSRPYAANKELGNELFKDSDIEKYRPKCGIYQKKYSYMYLAKKIRSDIPARYYVFKPLNSGMSNGVVLAPNSKLETALKMILKRVPMSQPIHTFNYRPTDTVTWDYWKYDRNPSFIVEEYVSSKPLEVNGKIYDPTMRIVFTMHHDQGNIFINFLELWWKIPKNSLDDRACSLTEKHVSKFRGDLSQLEADKLRVHEPDYSHLLSLMREIMPKLYLKMMKVYKTTTGYEIEEPEEEKIVPMDDFDS
jgi:hypothetical protein